MNLFVPTTELIVGTSRSLDPLEHAILGKFQAQRAIVKSPRVSADLKFSLYHSDKRALLTFT